MDDWRLPPRAGAVRPVGGRVRRRPGRAGRAPRAAVDRADIRAAGGGAARRRVGRVTRRRGRRAGRRVSGLHTRPAEIHHDGHQTGIQLELTTGGRPGAARRARGRALAARSSSSATSPRRCASLPEQLADAGAWPERMRVVERALLAALARHGAPEPRAEVGRALARLTRGATVQEVADEVGYSRRHLSTRRAGRVRASPRRSTSGSPASPRAARGWPRRRPPERPGRSRQWPRPAGTPTRPTSPGSGRRWPGARRRRGCARSSHSFKTSRTSGRQAEAVNPRKDPP